MKRNVILGLLLLALLALPLCSACTEPAEEPAATQAPTETQTPAETQAPAETQTPAETQEPAATETIELIFNHYMPDVAPVAQIAKAWGDKVEEMSDGRVKFVYYWGNTLMQPGETVKSMQQGIADVSYFTPEQDFQPLSYILYLPFMGFTDPSNYQTLLDEFPEMMAEYEGLKVLSAQLTPGSNLHFVEKEVKTVADIEGLKVRMAMATSLVTYLEATGATPVEVVPPELYMSLERGIIDGVNFNFVALDAHSCVELLPYHTIFGDAGLTADADLLIVCEKTWESLPEDIQQIFIEAGDWYTEQMAETNRSSTEVAIAKAEELGHTFDYLTPEEIQPWAELAEPIHQTWIDEMEAQGKPGQAVYDEAMRLIAAGE